MTAHEGARNLRLLLKELPRNHANKYSPSARDDLLRSLFYVLTGGKDEYIRLLWPSGHPPESWKLSEAQGAVEGAEYTEAARDKPCGHVFQEGEPTYFCKTCSADNTCVLCVKCYEASNHQGHYITVSLSKGSSGCCDCNDPEAWNRPLHCSIHSSSLGTTSEKPSQSSDVPFELRNNIRSAIGGALDYLCDVLSCSPEQIRQPKSVDAILLDEKLSRLTPWYGATSEPEIDQEFVLVLWNDEKHTVDEVAEHVALASRNARSYGLDRASEVDKIGRSIISRSRNIPDLVRQAEILSRIKVTVTIRSARDTFREEMCSTIIDWLNDIAGCSVGNDHHILMRTICEELLSPWTVRSNAMNLGIGRGGLIDHQRSDNRLDRRRERQALLIANRMRDWQTQARQEREDLQATVQQGDTRDDDNNEDDENIDDDDDDEDEDDDENADDTMDLDDDQIPRVDEGVLQSLYATAISPDDAEDSPEEEEGDDVLAMDTHADPNMLFTDIPRIRGQRGPISSAPAPSYWLATPNNSNDKTPASIYEDLSRRVRIDHLVFYDMRMWKTMRHKLRLLYISTVVAVPEFKRILSLRFATLYTHLAQLFFIADREAENSIIYLSLQMLTAPSIAQEIVNRTNFFTRLLAILYTFLTHGRVGGPSDVDTAAKIMVSTQAMANRRFYHIFNDIGFLLEVPSVREHIRTKQEYILQFLDFAKIFQGICPSRRAIGDHVEWESEAWIVAYHVNKEVTKMTRQFCDCFRWKRSQDPTNICRAIREAAKAATVSSLGVEAERYPDSDISMQTVFKRVKKYALVPNDNDPCYEPIVDCKVENIPMAFHHVLHYTLSWFIDAGKSMSSNQLITLLKFPHQRLIAPHRLNVPVCDSDQYLLAVFDVPLRVCAWAAQIRANIWVRNGYTLKTQMEYYRGVSHRDASHQRDLFMIQTAFVVCNPSRYLANVIDRYGMTDWMHAIVDVPEGIEDYQMVEMLEELLHLLIITLSNRTLLMPPEEESNGDIAIAKKDIIHALAFKPLTHSDLTTRLPEKVWTMANFDDILEQVAIYRPPEGLADSGTLVLKEECFDDIDPYYPCYNKSQREEAENILRARIARSSGIPLEEAFTLPQLRPIPDGVFMKIAEFSQTPLFAQVIHSSLRHVLGINKTPHSIKSTRIEALIHVLLYLVLIAVKEDNGSAASGNPYETSFLDLACTTEVVCDGTKFSILGLLFLLLQTEAFFGSKLRVRFLLKQIEAARPDLFAAQCRSQLPDIMRPELLQESDASASIDVSAKKKEALARQARVMAAFKSQQHAFMENQDLRWGDNNMKDSDDDWLEEFQSQPKAKTWGTPSGTCILCQDETNDTRLFGTLAYISDTRMFRVTPLTDVDYLMEVAHVPTNLDASHDAERPFGVASGNKAAFPYGQVAQIPPNGLGRSFPEPDQPNRSRDPVSTGCGHIMHYGCFEEYCSATARRQAHQHSRHHPERLDRKEFVCPLCKALGNAFMPATWRPQEAKNLERSPIAPFAVWMENQFERSRDLYFYNSWLNEKVPNDYLQRLKPVFSTEMPPTMIDGSQFIRSQNLRELAEANQRLTETTIRNTGGMPGTLESTIGKDTGYTEQVHAARKLIKAVGYSISAAEIAQRGNGTPIGIFVDSLPLQVTTQLRILSETTSSYLATVFGSGTDKKATSLRYWAQMHLRGCYWKIDQKQSAGLAATLMLSEDRFVHLAESSYWMGNVPTEEFYQQMRINYLAEIVGVVFAAIRRPDHVVVAFNHDSLFDTPMEDGSNVGFSQLVQEIISIQKSTCEAVVGQEVFVSDNPNDQDRIRFDRAVRRMATVYAHTFARKCALLMHVRFGVDYSIYRKTDAGELERLSEVLNLPTIDEVVADLFSLAAGGREIYELFKGWLIHWLTTIDTMWASAKRPQRTITNSDIDRIPGLGLRLPHPGIFELLALPNTFDTLNAVAVSRLCPTTGGPLSDPYICLLCGEMFCGQNSCCQPAGNKLGGCNCHIIKCGGNVGMFLSVRKCAVLMLNGRSGSWFAAPYLDRHGETDFLMKRHQQLFLNQKRYDRLFRDVWLGSSGGIASAVARKLEAELNTGGWEIL